MSKDSSPKYHQNNTGRLQEKKLVKYLKISQKKKLKKATIWS